MSEKYIKLDTFLIKSELLTLLTNVFDGNKKY